MPEKKVESAPTTGQQERSDNGTLQIAAFRLGKEEFGIDILYIREIIRMPVITRVPNAPEYVLGIFNMRGKVVPVVDITRKLGVSRNEESEETKVVVVQVHNVLVGFVVDAVSEVQRVAKSIIVPPPALMEGVNTKYVEGLARMDDRLIILLDLPKLLELEDEVESEQG